MNPQALRTKSSAANSHTDAQSVKIIENKPEDPKSKNLHSLINQLYPKDKPKVENKKPKEKGSPLKSLQNSNKFPKLVQYTLDNSQEFEEWNLINHLKDSNLFNSPEGLSKALHVDLSKLNQGGKQMDTDAKVAGPFQTTSEEGTNGYFSGNFAQNVQGMSPQQMQAAGLFGHWQGSPNPYAQQMAMMNAHPHMYGNYFPNQFDKNARSPDVNNDPADRKQALMSSLKLNLPKDDMERLLDVAISNYQRKNIDIYDSVKEMEKENAVRVLAQRLMSMLKEKDDLQNTIDNLNHLLQNSNKQRVDRESTLQSELSDMKQYAARNSEQKFKSLEEENRKLREQIQEQKKKFVEMENQFRHENQELMNLYIDAEETKTQILEQLVKIKQSREKIELQKHDQSQQQPFDTGRQSGSRLRSARSRQSGIGGAESRDNSMGFQKSESPKKGGRVTSFGVGEHDISDVSVNPGDESHEIRKKFQETPSISDFNVTHHEDENTDRNYANAINDRLQKLNNMVGYSDQNSMMSKEDDTSIGKLRQMIANLQNFDVM